MVSQELSSGCRIHRIESFDSCCVECISIGLATRHHSNSVGVADTVLGSVNVTHSSVRLKGRQLIKLALGQGLASRLLSLQLPHPIKVILTPLERSHSMGQRTGVVDSVRIQHSHTEGVTSIRVRHSGCHRETTSKRVSLAPAVVSVCLRDTPITTACTEVIVDQVVGSSLHVQHLFLHSSNLFTDRLRLSVDVGTELWWYPSCSELELLSIQDTASVLDQVSAINKVKHVFETYRSRVIKVMLSNCFDPVVVFHTSKDVSNLSVVRRLRCRDTIYVTGL